MDLDTFKEAVAAMRELQRGNGAPKALKAAEAKVDRMLEPQKPKVDPRQLPLFGGVS